MAAANPPAFPSESGAETTMLHGSERELPAGVDVSSAKEPWSSSSLSGNTGSRRSTTPSGVTSLKSKIPNSTANDPIDSALLAALRDSREKLGLLKLEQVFLQFLKSEDPFWEVGGAGNSQVRNAQGVWISNADASAAMGYRPQTSFQRCILHRLADRFQITREPQENGFIRICKTPFSGLPSRLLLNVAPSEYMQSAQHLKQQQSPSSGASQLPSRSGPNAQPQQQNTNSFHHQASNSSLEDQMEQQLSLQTSPNQKQKQAKSSSVPAGILPSQAGGAASSKSSKPRKMKIMKRSSSNLSTNSNASKNSSKGSTNNGSGANSGNSISDRERKYAEARARIFQQSQEEAMAETLPLAASAHLQNTPGDSSTSATSAAATTLTPSASSPQGGMAAPMSSSTSSSLTATSAEYVPPNNSLHGSIPNPISHPSASSASTSPHGSIDTSQNNESNLSSTNKPSKATWRNRQSEMQDPDFRRRRTPVVVHPVAGNHHARNTTAAVAAALNGNPSIGFGYGAGGTATAAAIPSGAFGLSAKNNLYHHTNNKGTIGSTSINNNVNPYYQQTSPSISKLNEPQNFYATAAATSGVPPANKAVQYSRPAAVGYASSHFPPPSQQQQQQQHQYHIHNSMAATTAAAAKSVPSIHSSQDFPSLR